MKPYKSKFSENDGTHPRHSYWNGPDAPVQISEIEEIGSMEDIDVAIDSTEKDILRLKELMSIYTIDDEMQKSKIRVKLQKMINDIRSISEQIKY